MERWRLQQKQSLPLEQKVQLTQFKIRKWYEHWGGGVSVSFSGGKDSTVLLDLVRSQYPSIPAVFANTGQEYADIIRFIKSFGNIAWVKPKMTFWDVVEKHGWPVISKKVSMGLARYRNTKSQLQRDLRINGGICPTSGKAQYRTIPIKWQFLLKAPFKCSDICCDILKKRPLKKYAKETGRRTMLATMADESTIRTVQYLKTGCNAFDSNTPISTPMAFWTEEDIWAYIKSRDLPYSDIYNKGERRTGCKYCIFGAHMEKEPNRFQRMRKNFPGQFANFERHGGCNVLDFIGIPHREPNLLF